MAKRRQHQPVERRPPKRAAFSLSPAGRVVVIADTHSRPHPDSHRLVAAQRPELILHGGDIGDPEVIAGFERIAPVVAVRGNIDSHGPFIPEDVHLTLTQGPQELSLFLTHIALSGVRLRADVARAAKAAGASMVVCGHSHIPFIGRDRDLLVFNPGSIGPRRFRLPIVFGVMELGEPEPSLAHISCETGSAWVPNPVTV